MMEHEKHGVVEIGDDSMHTIKHIGDVPFRNNNKYYYIKDVLHDILPTITKNLVSIG